MENREGRGFSLVELMIVVVVVAILTAIALPSYRAYLIRASRSAVQTELLDLASLQEKIYLNSNAYAPSVTGAYDGTSAGGLGRTSGASNDAKYTFSLDILAPAQTFTLTATPVAGSMQDGDGALSINQSGRRLWAGNPW